MTHIVTIKRKTVKPVVEVEVIHAPHSIVWQEIGGAQYDEPTFDRDEILDAVAFQRWQEDLVLQDD